MILLITLGWLFCGLLAVGVLRRIFGKRSRNETLALVLLGLFSVLMVLVLWFLYSDWWNEKI